MTLAQEDLDAAAKTLHESRTVYLFSRDDEKPTRDLLARRLRRLGLTTVTLGPTPKDLAERFVSFDEQSTLYLLGQRRAAPGSHGGCRRVRRRLAT